MEIDPSIGFAFPLLLFPPQEYKINKRFVLLEDNKWKRMSFHILKLGHKNLYNERNFLWRISEQRLNSQHLFK